MISEETKALLSFLGPDLIEELQKTCEVIEVDKGTELVRAGQYVKVIPIVIHGVVKVISKSDERELLLYYIQPKESCIMSFASSLYRTPSKIFAIAEEKTKLLLVPSGHIKTWMVAYPKFNQLFYNQYHVRYVDLIDTIHQILFQKLDARCYQYLVDKSAVFGQNPIQISHREIANDLGTAREVISRIMKKMETEGKVIQGNDGIKIL